MDLSSDSVPVARSGKRKREKLGRRNLFICCETQSKATTNYSDYPYSSSTPSPEKIKHRSSGWKFAPSKSYLLPACSHLPSTENARSTSPGMPPHWPYPELT
jgi:hypothetical protein